MKSCTNVAVFVCFLSATATFAVADDDVNDLLKWRVTAPKSGEFLKDNASSGSEVSTIDTSNLGLFNGSPLTPYSEPIVVTMDAEADGETTLSGDVWGAICNLGSSLGSLIGVVLSWITEHRLAVIVTVVIVIVVKVMRGDIVL